MFEIDYICVCFSIISREPYIDKTRIGAYGKVKGVLYAGTFQMLLLWWWCCEALWCGVVFQVYGGYVTSLLLSAEDSPVKCGAVLSPITDFELFGKWECCLWDGLNDKAWSCLSQAQGACCCVCVCVRVSVRGPYLEPPSSPKRG